MNRDSFLYLLIGVLIGFVVAYIAMENVAPNQPTRRAAPETGVAAGPAPPPAPPANNPAAASGGGGAAAMEQVQRLRQYVEENPEDAQALRLLANMNYDIQNWSRAAELYERLRALEPGDPDVLTDLGISLRNLGRPQDALELFRETQALDASYWPARFNEILVLAYDLEDGEAAKQKLAELQALQPSNDRVNRLAQDIEGRFGS